MLPRAAWSVKKARAEGARRLTLQTPEASMTEMGRRRGEFKKREFKESEKSSHLIIRPGSVRFSPSLLGKKKRTGIERGNSNDGEPTGYGEAYKGSR